MIETVTLMIEFTVRIHFIFKTPCVFSALSADYSQTRMEECLEMH